MSRTNKNAQDFLRVHEPGLGHVGSYQVSGRPYITGSNNLDDGAEHELAFPFVTSRLTIINHSSSTIRVHFASKDTGNTISGYHFIELDSDEDSIEMNIKCNKVFISNASGTDNLEYRVIAELTSIEEGRMYELDTTGISGVSE